MTPEPYCGRFAPSPTGALHRGSLVSALASYLDARAHHGRWLVRIEDIDGPRTVPGCAADILQSLASLGMRSDAPPLWQSQRHAAYQQAFEQLRAAALVYPCGCSRKEIADSLLASPAAHSASLAPERHATLVYPGTCRLGLHGKPARAWRLRVPQTERHPINFTDRWQGPQSQDLAAEVGDFILKRADDQWAYQLAVVVDDAAAQVTHVVRGADLLDSTARQITLQRCLGLPQPAYLHVPIVCAANGEKLSKQTGAEPLDSSRPLAALHAAAAHLGLMLGGGQAASIDAFYAAAVPAWCARLAAHVQS